MKSTKHKDPSIKTNIVNHKKIRNIHHLHKKNGQTKLDYTTWLSIYFFESTSKKQITEYLEEIIKKQGNIKTIISKHPTGKERAPIHLAYIYMHEIHFQKNFKTVLFQKYNFSKSLNSLITSFIWSYLPKMSSEFRKHHRIYETSHNFKQNFIHPHPKYLWESYKKFLFLLGEKYKNKKETNLGPTWILINDLTTVTLAICDKDENVGTSAHTKIIDTIHNGIQTNSFNKKDFELLGKTIGKTLNASYEKKLALIDLNLGNFILDHTLRARLIDGELLQVFKTEVPAHYKVMELVLIMQTLFLETVQDYCRKIGSMKTKDIKTYQQGLVILFSSILNELRFSDDDIKIAVLISQDWSTKLSILFYRLCFYLNFDAKMINKYREVLSKNLMLTLKNHTNIPSLQSL